MSTQSEKLTAIANAIRAKEGSSDLIPANDFPARIAAIETGIQLPTLTNPGTAADLARGKQLIGQDGEIVTGTIKEVNLDGGYGYPPEFKNNGGINYIGFSSGNLYDRILRAGSPNIMLYGLASDFGDATAADVAYGKTFTSEAGVKVTGTSTGPKGFFISFQGLDSNTSGWFSYPGTGYPLSLCVYALGGITTGSDIFMIGMAGNAGAYVTGTKKAIVEEVNYGGSASQSAFGVSISNGQISFDSVSGTYFKSGVQYVGCGICN